MLVHRHPKYVVGIVFLLLVASILTVPLTAAERPKDSMVMTVGEMCGGCVKKITKRFDKEKSVSKVICSIEKKQVTLIPKKGVQLSPKGIWNVMDDIGKTPKKMVYANKTYTSKPKK